MATYEISGPDGSVYHIDGPEGASHDDLVAAVMKQSAPQPEAANRMAFAPSDLAKLAPPMNNTDYAKDIAKSGGIGLARGIVGLSTLPGNIEQLGRAGINYAVNKGMPQSPIVNNIADAVAKMTGNDTRNVVSPETKLPTMGDVIAKDEAQTGRKWYEPQTTAGEYARTAGEFAPSALAGGPETSLLTRALNVAVPAITSETAGQATKGTALEPYARTAGALVSGKMPNAANIPARVVSPLAARATQLEHVANLENQGITALSAGERSGNTGLRYVESEAANSLFGGGNARTLEIKKGQQATKAALAHAGLDLPDIGPKSIIAGDQHFSNAFDGLASMTKFRVDPKLMGELADARAKYAIGLPLPSRTKPIPIVDDLVNDIRSMGGTGGPQLTGAQYQAIRSTIGKEIADNRLNNPRLSRALGDVQDALDDAMERFAGPKVAQAWQDTRGQYRNWLAIKEAASAPGQNTANGILSMPALRTALSKQETKRNFAKSQRPLVELARSAEGVMKPLPNSGTNARGGLRRIASLGGALVGAAAGSPAGIAGSSAGALLGLVTPPILEGLAAKGLMSKSMQGYLKNQATAGPLAAYNAGKSTPWWYLPQGLSAAEAEAAGSPSASKKKK